MIRRIGVLGISLLCFAAFVSCEKDFNDIGSSVVNNSKFETGEILLDVEIQPIDISDANTTDLYKSVRADNISIGSLGEYWLGVYKNDNYKTIEASFVSQLNLPADLKTKDTNPATQNGEIDSIYTLDKVILKLPYIATNTGKNNTGQTVFKLDSVLGNSQIPTSLKVLRNGTYLNVLDPNNPAKSNSFQSNHPYDELELLNEDAGFTFQPNPNDTIFVVTRNISNGNTYQDTLRLTNKAPFIAVSLNKDRMKELFWDEFKNETFNSSEALNNYFRGLIVKAEGNDGAMIPLNLTGNATSASLDFHYTITTFQKEDGKATLTLKDTLPNTYSFPLSGVRNSIYKMTPTTKSIPANNFHVQGTAGSMARIKILDNTKLQNLRANNWLVNDASLSFHVNPTINNDKNLIPQKLFLYQEKKNDSGEISPTHISDVYVDLTTFGGALETTEDNIPEKYTFRITNYISNLLNRVENTTIDPLVLKVYNTTDIPTSTTLVDTYNWNPRGVTLLDGNKTNNGTKRAVLKISYSKEK